ncbi:MAG: transposase [Bryobacteraceae bacterium]|nr:transposase [Bryobacteraceae bacterium]
MPKHTITISPLPARTIGLDLSDRTLRYCELDAAGEILAEGVLPMKRAALCKYLSAQPAGTRVALETGGQSAWVRDVIAGTGHEPVVANARELAAVTQTLHRTDQRDARQLARLARLAPELLNPVKLRDRVVDLRFFAGLTEEETAKLLEVPPVTVQKDWRFAKGWLMDRLEGGRR